LPSDVHSSRWSNGRIEVRNDTTGEVVFKDNMDTAIAAILQVRLNPKP